MPSVFSPSIVRFGTSKALNVKMLAGPADLYEHMVHPDFRDAEGVTDLMRWSWEGVPEAVDHIIRLGAKVDERDNNGLTALFYAIGGAKKVGVIRALLAAGADPNARSPGKATPLMGLFATNARDLFAKDAFQILIEAGANINVVEDSGRTPLMYAAMLRNIEAIKALVEAGADITVRDREGLTVSQLAGRCGHSGTHVARYLRELEKRASEKSKSCV